MCRGCDGCCIFCMNYEQARRKHFNVGGAKSESSCGSPQLYVLHDLQFVNAGRGGKRHTSEPVS